MSQPFISLKPEDIDTASKRGKYTACIVGCGQDGILHAIMFADSGFKVICYDSDQTVTDNLAKGKAPSSDGEIESKLKNGVRAGRITAVDDLKKAISTSDIVAITIPPKVDSKKKVNYSDFENMCKRIGSSLRVGTLVLIMKPTGIGITEGMVKETLENTSGFKLGVTLGLAYSPLTSSEQARLVAAADRASLNISAAVLGPMSKGGLVKTKNVKATETAVLFQVQKDDVDLALASELAVFCEKTKTDYLEVSDLLGPSAIALFPSTTRQDKNVRKEPYLLMANAEDLNVKLRVPTIAREINDQQVKHLSNLVKDALSACEKSLRRARVSLLGVSQTPNVRSHRKRIVKDLAQSLTTKGARISVYDPYFSENDLQDFVPNAKKTLNEAVEGADCIVITTGHDQFKKLSLPKLKLIMKKPSAIVDFEGIMEPEKVEKEGFIYRGYGRGLWTK
jgi:UDP-N-acetyl-D-mannosaminuronic acid dehydrogenase